MSIRNRDGKKQSASTEPPGWSWEEYEGWLVGEWRVCLDLNADNEGAVHQFLERHPCLLPGGEATSESIGGHHGPHPGVVISKPPLQGTFRRYPDFLWPTKMSSTFVPVFIELERPSKRWFRADGQQTADLTQAINQVAEWRTWLQSPANALVFYEAYGISDHIRAYHTIEPAFQLIYGRRAEFGRNRKLSKHRESLRPGWLNWRTYDRLTPSANARRWMSVKVTTRGWQVIAIPPTFALPPWSGSYLQGLIGLPDAIQDNEMISDQRKAFLLEQLSRIEIKPAADPQLWEKEWHDWLEDHPEVYDEPDYDDEPRESDYD